MTMLGLTDENTSTIELDVAFQHREYNRFLPQWEKCRDVVSGEEAVKEKGAVYLPLLKSGENDVGVSGQGAVTGEYEAYKMRAEFFAAAYRAVQGLAGAVTRKQPTIVCPPSLKPLFDHLGNRGEPLLLLVSMAMEEVLTTGRLGVYVDASDGPSAEPYVAFYHPENIINWRTRPGANGRQIYELIVLKEHIDQPNPDGFTSECIEQYRVLRLSDDPEPIYSVEIYHKIEVTDQQTKKVSIVFQLQDQILPRMNGGKLFAEIPFVFIGPDGITGEVAKSPIIDLVNTNLSHYRTSADLEHGRHWVALPTPYAIGLRLDSKPKIGPTAMLYTESPTGKFGMLEFTGQGLKSLENALQEKQDRMATLAGSILEGKKTDGVEAAETVKLRTAGEHSVLSNIAISVGSGLTKAMQIICEWLGVSDKASIVLSQDFNATSMDAQLMNALLMALVQGKMSYKTYVFNMKRGEMYPDGWTEEDERQAIMVGDPIVPPATIKEEDQLAQDKTGGNMRGGIDVSAVGDGVAS